MHIVSHLAVRFVRIIRRGRWGLLRVDRSPHSFISFLCIPAPVFSGNIDHCAQRCILFLVDFIIIVIAVPECREYGSIYRGVFACFLLFLSVSVLRVRFYNKYITGRHTITTCVSWVTKILGQGVNWLQLTPIFGNGINDLMPRLRRTGVKVRFSCRNFACSTWL